MVVDSFPELYIVSISAHGSSLNAAYAIKKQRKEFFLKLVTKLPKTSQNQAAVKPGDNRKR